MPRTPWLENLSAYQYLLNVLKKDYQQKVDRLSDDVMQTLEFSAYQELVDQKLSIYKSKVDHYSVLISGLLPELQKYFVFKSADKKMVQICLNEGVSLTPIFNKVDELDAPVHLAFLKGLGLIGIPESEVNTALLKNQNVDDLTDSLVNSLFDALKGASGAELSQLEICQHYLTNNIRRPERKAFINKAPDSFKIMDAAK